MADSIAALAAVRNDHNVPMVGDLLLQSDLRGWMIVAGLDIEVPARGVRTEAIYLPELENDQTETWAVVFRPTQPKRAQNMLLGHLVVQRNAPDAATLEAAQALQRMHGTSR